MFTNEPENVLYVGRFRRPTCSGFGDGFGEFKYRCVPGGPK